MKIDDKKKRICLNAIVVVVIFVGIGIWYLCSSHIVHREAKIISPDGKVKYEIYNVSLEGTKNDDGKKIITIQEYDLSDESSDWKLVSTTEVAGEYKNYAWTGDGERIIINVANGNQSLYHFERANAATCMLDYYIDMRLIDKAKINSRLYEYLLSEDQKLEYELMQVKTDSDWMLIHYKGSPKTEDGKEQTALSGYFWFNCKDTTIDGLVEMSK